MESFNSLLRFLRLTRASSEDEALDIVGILPPELAIMILRKLDGPSLLAASTVSGRWQCLIQSDRVLARRRLDAQQYMRQEQLKAQQRMRKEQLEAQQCMHEEQLLYQQQRMCEEQLEALQRILEAQKRMREEQQRMLEAQRRMREEQLEVRQRMREEQLFYKQQCMREEQLEAQQRMREEQLFYQQQRMREEQLEAQQRMCEEQLFYQQRRVREEQPAATGHGAANARGAPGADLVPQVPAAATPKHSGVQMFPAPLGLHEAVKRKISSCLRTAKRKLAADHHAMTSDVTAQPAKKAMRL